MNPNKETPLQDPWKVLAWFVCLCRVLAVAPELRAESGSAADSASTSVPKAANDIETIDELWAAFDPKRDPFEEEVFRTDLEDDGRIRVEWLYFTGQTWDGEKTRVFAYRGAPKDGNKLPGVLHIHGGGQTANVDWVRYWAKRGYVCVSFDFCGDTNLPNLGPEYRRQNFTRWGKIQANMMQVGGGRQMDPGPEYNPWHHWVRMARRSLTLLENHPQVDPERLGVFGISVGGTMTWMVAGIDSRVKAAVPIYGNGWESYRHPIDGPQDPADRSTKLWRMLIAPEAYAPRITCPILFLSATNDGHGRIDVAGRTLELTHSPIRRQLYSAGYDHHIEPEEGRCLEFWMDVFLKRQGGPWPATPVLRGVDGSAPALLIEVDKPEEVVSVYVYQCINNALPMSRYWQMSHDVKREGGSWKASVILLDKSDTIFALATIVYRSGIRVSSGIVELKAASWPSALPKREWNPLISEMDTPDDWYFVPAYTDPNKGLSYFEAWVGSNGEKGFTLNPSLCGVEKLNFHMGTHKIGAPQWRGSGKRALAIDILSSSLPLPLQLKVVEENRLPSSKEYTARPEIQASRESWTTVILTLDQFVDAGGKSLQGWEKVDFLALIGTGSAAQRPVFHNLRWVTRE